MMWTMRLHVKLYMKLQLGPSDSHVILEVWNANTLVDDFIAHASSEILRGPRIIGKRKV